MDAQSQPEGSPDMEKSLITAVNPVVKPPRQYSVPPSVASGVTELSEVNRTLLDNDSYGMLLFCHYITLLCGSYSSTYFIIHILIIIQ